MGGDEVGDALKIDVIDRAIDGGRIGNLIVAVTMLGDFNAALIELRKAIEKRTIGHLEEERRRAARQAIAIVFDRKPMQVFAHDTQRNFQSAQ